MALRHTFLPFASFDTELDRLFDDFFPGTGSPLARPAQAPYLPLNVWEDTEKFVVEAEVPGIAMEDLELSVHQDTLTIRGERKLEVEEKRSIRRQERIPGQFERSLALPMPIEAGQVSANLEHGVLTITLPKAESARPRRIPVHAN
jgi:HSP20 family protein